MKNTVKLISALLVIVMLVMSAVSCTPTVEPTEPVESTTTASDTTLDSESSTDTQKVDATGLWKSATYLSDTTLGSGANTVKVELVAEEQKVVFTVKTDKATLGEALYEVGLINDPSFFDVCNGMKADWNADQAYWGFLIDGQMADYGVGDARAVTTGEPVYQISYIKY